jgi:hypothetical protein
MLWPHSLRAQVMGALALALLLAQGIGAALLYRAQAEYREEQVTHALAIKLVMASHDDFAPPPPPEAPDDKSGTKDASKTPAKPGTPDTPEEAGEHRFHRHHHHGPPPEDVSRGPRTENVDHFALQSFDRPLPEMARRLSPMLTEQDVNPAGLLVCQRPLMKDPMMMQRIERRAALMRRHVNLPHPPPLEASRLLIAAVPRPGGGWLVSRVVVSPEDPWLPFTLVAQTLFIYLVLVGTMALILRRIIRPLAALTSQVEQFAETRVASNRWSRKARMTSAA